MIRKIQKNDKAAYIEMAKMFYSSEAVLNKIDEKHFNITFNELMRSDVYTECYILEYNKCIAGYALLAKTFSQEAGGLVIWVEEIFIKPEYRSKGLGTELFNFLDNSKEVKRLRLEVEPENDKAISLYKRIGYKDLAYIQMKKELN